MKDMVEDLSLGETGLENQFALVTVGTGHFAIGLSALREIIRVPLIVRAPLSPAALTGFANLRGTVLPVIDLCRILGFEAPPHDTNARVLVCEAESNVGLIVQAMNGIMTVPSGRIEAVSQIDAVQGGDLVTGVFQVDDRLHLVLSIETILDRAFRCLRERKAPKVAEFRRSTGSSEAPAPVPERLFLTFTISSEEFGLPIETVSEIVSMPERVTPIPNSKPHIPAMVTLRDRLLPLVDLGRLLGMSGGTDARPDNRQIVVARTPSGLGGGMVGLIADDVREVLPVAQGTLGALPQALSTDGGRSEITAVCQLDGGRRMVGILDIDRLLEQADLGSFLASHSSSHHEADEMKVREDVSVGDDLLIVVFGLGAEEYGIAISSVQEIISLPDKVTRFPKAPHYLDGVINLRGAILPVIDTRKKFGLPPRDRTPDQQILVLSDGSSKSGFVVDSVSEVLSAPRSAVKPAPKFEAQVINLVTHVLSLDENKRMILLLDAADVMGRHESHGMAAV